MPARRTKETPSDVRVPFSSYLPLEYRERLQELARRERTTVTGLLNEALDLLFEKRAKK